MDTEKYLTVKDWADEDRPREKLLHQGPKSMSNTELIAILIRSGVPGKSAVAVAREILQLAGQSLSALSQLEYKQLATIKGLGSAKAATLMAALEIGWRMQGEIDNNKELIINGSETLFNYLAPLIANIDHEEFWVIFLNNRLRVIGRQRIAVGGQTETQVDLRILFRTSLESKATMIAVAHNHPSGNLCPSKQDQLLTRRIQEAGETLGIRLIEHIIIGIEAHGKASYYSFSDHGML